MLNKTRKTIAKKKTTDSLGTFTGMEKEDRELLIETRNNKMEFEIKKHSDITQMHKEKIGIEKERLLLEKDNLSIKKRHIMVQTTLERSKLVMVKLDIFKARKAIKKEDPTVTEEYLNLHFPFPDEI
jgi:hypothetical protein